MKESENKKQKTPDNFKLLDGEQIYKVHSFKLTHPQLKPSGYDEIYRLTASSGENGVGTNGPSVAALSSGTDSSKHNNQGLYSTIFGRDSLRVALDLVDHYPKLAKETIQHLAELQGTVFNTDREEEPGRIPHEVRDVRDPIAIKLTKERGWGWPYYGSVDATPEFIRTLSAYCKLSDYNNEFLSYTYTDKSGQPQTISTALIRAVDWMVSHMDSNPEGLVEYKSVLRLGIENQVWKDSWDAYHHSDGTIANHNQGIAAVEVQTVSHDALLDAADLYDNILIDKHEQAQQLRQRAKILSKRILDIFWTDDKGGYFVLGTDRDDDGNLRQLKVRASNMGHILNSRVIDGDDEEHTKKRLAILRQLQSPEMMAIGGIRTLANDEVRFREGAYHNGSVWIWDTYHIIKGAFRHTKTNPEFESFAKDLEKRIQTIVNVIGEFPEHVRGGDEIAVNTRIIDVYDSKAKRINRVEQPPQEVQAWTVAAILATKWRQEQ
jgi:glycogen debranching enzyme